MKSDSRMLRLLQGDVGSGKTIVALMAMLTAVEAGATSVIQPGGSKRDAEVIEACEQAGVSMVFTRHRHFRH